MILDLTFYWESPDIGGYYAASTIPVMICMIYSKPFTEDISVKIVPNVFDCLGIYGVVSFLATEFQRVLLESDEPC